MSLLLKPKDFEDFFRLLNCRVQINEKEETGFAPLMLEIKVPKKNYHFVRKAMADMMPMGILYDVKRLGFWDCRIKRYQFNFRRFE